MLHLCPFVGAGQRQTSLYMYVGSKKEPNTAHFGCKVSLMGKKLTTLTIQVENCRL